MNYAQQLEFVRNQGLIPGENKRVDCPGCSGKNTLSMSSMPGNLLWNCFRASCVIKGDSRGNLSPEAIRKILAFREEQDAHLEPWEPPAHLLPIYVSPAAVAYVKDVHSYIVYQEGLVDIKWDPQKNRVVFIQKYNGYIYNAHGRALNSATEPKWLRYNDNAPALPFIVNRGSRLGVIVEDPPSACAVAAAGVGGIALCGTNFMDEFISVLSENFGKLIVAMDFDASDKSIAIQRKLNYLIPSTVQLIKNDLKEHTPLEIAKILKLEK